MSEFRTPAWLMGPGRASQYDLRVSDAERQQVADELSRHFGDGRLDQAEFDQRLDQAMHATTYRDLDGLLADLPPAQASGGAGLPPGGPGVAGRVAGRPPQRRLLRPLLLIVAVIVAASIAGHAVAWAFGGWLWIALICLAVLMIARRTRRVS